MIYNNDFKYDLQLGIKGESLVAKMLSNKKIEVKTDLKANETGNVFIEYESRKKPSGLSTTEAEWFCFVLSNENIIFVETKRLKEICRIFFKTRRDVLGGDKNTSKGILLPINYLVKL
jgi:hypothetical protein|tara:strand:- start:201 stop:554 length:354 start_codon:yes stop_codon:yes gene_type:complete